jgi:hypothetical protein
MDAQKDWAYSGGEWTAAIGGTRGVFATTEADFNAFFSLANLGLFYLLPFSQRGRARDWRQ